MKRNWIACPCCGGEGGIEYPVWGMDGTDKCWTCKGFGLVSGAEWIEFFNNVIEIN